MKHERYSEVRAVKSSIQVGREMPVVEYGQRGDRGLLEIVNNLDGALLQ